MGIRPRRSNLARIDRLLQESANAFEETMHGFHIGGRHLGQGKIRLSSMAPQKRLRINDSCRIARVPRVASRRGPRCKRGAGVRGAGYPPG